LKDVMRRAINWREDWLDFLTSRQSKNLIKSALSPNLLDPYSVSFNYGI